jgi:hypothetical protein
VCDISQKIEFYKLGLSICQNFEKSQNVCKMGLPRLIKQSKLAHEG